VSVHDELSVLISLERELGDIVPRQDVAATVIRRFRRERRRKRVGLAVAAAGLGVPLTIIPLTAGAPAGPVLHLAAYTLRLPPTYHQPCQPNASHLGVSAASAAGGCIFLVLAPATRSGREVAAGRYRVRIIPHGLVVEPPAPGAQSLSVTAPSLSEPQLERLVATGLSYAA